MDEWWESFWGRVLMGLVVIVFSLGLTFLHVRWEDEAKQYQQQEKNVRDAGVFVMDKK